MKTGTENPENPKTDWRALLQSYCFWWEQTHKHAACEELSGRKCLFCELVERWDREH